MLLIYDIFGNAWISRLYYEEVLWNKIDIIIVCVLCLRR